MTLVMSLSSGVSRAAVSSSRAVASTCAADCSLVARGAAWRLVQPQRTSCSSLNHRQGGVSLPSKRRRGPLRGARSSNLPPLPPPTHYVLPAHSASHRTGARGIAAAAAAADGASGDDLCYVTTPIYYVNDKPHIGHVYTSTLADVYARYNRAAGKEVFFLTGTDEHGLKVEQSAQKRGIDPQALADENSAAFRTAMEAFGISFDHFIRTTDAAHKQQVASYVSKLMDAGMIYLGTFEGWYDEGQEEYHTETQAAELEYKSPISGKPLVKATEENYYFKLSAFQERLEELYASQPDFVAPAARRNELLNRLKGGLQDVPVSRTNFKWGIPMPGHEEHVVYVWIDALFNYITALGLAEEEPARGRYWPASKHVMAKEITWFHGIIWPAVLMALDLPLPKEVYAHGFWIRDGKKMSKTLGNFVDLTALQGYADLYTLDGLRFYLVLQGPLGNLDANFSDYMLHQVYTTQLANTVGNCASRTAAMVNKYYKDQGGGLPSERGADGARVEVDGYDWPAVTAAAAAKVDACMAAFDIAGAAEAAMKVILQVDVFIAETEPYKLAKDPEQAERLAAILYQSLEALRIGAVLLEPVMPTKMAELAAALGTAEMPGTLQERAVWGGLQPGQAVQKVALFPRVDTPEAAQREMEARETAAV